MLSLPQRSRGCLPGVEYRQASDSAVGAIDRVTVRRTLGGFNGFELLNAFMAYRNALTNLFPLIAGYKGFNFVLADAFSLGNLFHNRYMVDSPRRIEF